MVLHPTNDTAVPSPALPANDRIPVLCLGYLSVRVHKVDILTQVASGRPTSLDFVPRPLPCHYKLLCMDSSVFNDCRISILNTLWQLLFSSFPGLLPSCPLDMWPPSTCFVKTQTIIFNSSRRNGFVILSQLTRPAGHYNTVVLRWYVNSFPHGVTHASAQSWSSYCHLSTSTGKCVDAIMSWHKVLL